jgi:RNA polymerase sigma factor (sigma-70 family)
MQIVESHAGRRLTEAATREYLQWDRRTERTRSDIVRVNMPLVLAMAKRTRIHGVDFADLISEGNLALMRSVDKFDCARGFKFSTYACRAILKSFSRVATRTSRYRGHFPTEFDPTLEKSDHLEKKRVGVEDDCVDELRAILGENTAQLSDVEVTVIRARFALDGSDPTEGESRRGKTLEQVGEMIGVTKERVRQIQNKALGKLRVALEDGVLAV